MIRQWFQMTVLAMGALAASTACGPGSGVTPSCAQNGTECKCQNTPFSLGAGWSIVPSCDSPSAGETWVCTYDLDSVGQSTTCDCLAYQCVVTTGSSREFTSCGASDGCCDLTGNWADGIPTLESSGQTCQCSASGQGGSTGATVSSACPSTLGPAWTLTGGKFDIPAAPTICCASTTEQECTCTASVSVGLTGDHCGGEIEQTPIACPSGTVQVDNCATSNAPNISTATLTAPTCGGLNWAPPPPPPSSPTLIGG
jgi:hypothetical protein